MHDCNLTIALRASVKEYDAQKTCYLGIGIGNSPTQHLHIRSYNSYYHCEEICISKSELSADMLPLKVDHFFMYRTNLDV